MPGNGGGARISASPVARAVVKPPPAHYLHELPAQDEERLARLFQRLDLDGNGRVDVHDLSRELGEVGVHSQYAQVFVKHIFTISTCHIEEMRSWSDTVTSILGTLSCTVVVSALGNPEMSEMRCIKLMYILLYTLIFVPFSNALLFFV